MNRRFLVTGLLTSVVNPVLHATAFSAMKKILYLLCTFLLLPIQFNSCSKKEVKTSETKEVKKEKTEFTTGFYCEIDGKEWFLPDSVSYMTSSTNRFKIFASKGNGKEGPYEEFFFYIKSPLKITEFPIAYGADLSIVQFHSNQTLNEKKSKGGVETFWSKSGRISVTKFDDSHAEGTFEFTAITTDDPPRTMMISNGKFNLKIKNK